MTGLPGSPAQVQPGVVVRIRLSGLVYTSKRMTRGEALDTSALVKAKLRGSRGSGLVDLPEFPSAELEELAVMGERVTAVEVRCVTGSGALIRDLDLHPADARMVEASS